MKQLVFIDRKNETLFTIRNFWIFAQEWTTLLSLYMRNSASWFFKWNEYVNYHNFHMRKLITWNSFEVKFMSTSAYFVYNTDNIAQKQFQAAVTNTRKY